MVMGLADCFFNREDSVSFQRHKRYLKGGLNRFFKKISLVIKECTISFVINKLIKHNGIYDE